MIKKIKNKINNKIQQTKTEHYKQYIINGVCKDEKKTLKRLKILLYSGLAFIEREKYIEAQICNNEIIQILNKILFEAKKNKENLKDILNEKEKK